MAGPTWNHDNSITKMGWIHRIYLVLQVIMIIDEAGSLGMGGPTKNCDNSICLTSVTHAKCGVRSTLC